MINFKFLLIVSILVTAICIVSILLLFTKKEEHIENTIKQNNNIEIQDTITLDNIEANNIKILSKNNKWYLNIDFINNTEEEQTLNDYEVILYDTNNNYIKTIGIDIPITINKQEKHTLSLESTTDISNTKKIEIVKK